MYRVIAAGSEEIFSRWTDAVNKANSLIPSCKSFFQDVRIYDGEELIWVYSRLHKYPQYIGAGTYNRLARIFIAEAMEEEQS